MGRITAYIVILLATFAVAFTAGQALDASPPDRGDDDASTHAGRTHR